MKHASANPTLKSSPTDTDADTQNHGKVDAVVQEYMDNLLNDLFPIAEAPEVSLEPQTVKTEIETPHNNNIIADSQISSVLQTSPEPTQTYAKVIPHVIEPNDNILPSLKNVTAINPQQAPVETKTDALDANPQDVLIDTQIDVPADIPLTQKSPTETVEAVEPLVKIEVETAVETINEKTYPNAPDWAQTPFDVLLFDVCGLKLAVPMEFLGRIIKVEHETNQLIGRPNWFMGAYNEADEHLYVVDTAKYIMPEKGFDLTRDGFTYLIQLQKSKWTLACKDVHTTVRLEPDQVKWRSSQGKRQWLSGTVIEHMCALIHVDNLVTLLEADS